MGSGWHEWPLMIFTVFGQCVVGGFIVLELASLAFRRGRRLRDDLGSGRKRVDVQWDLS